MSWQTICCNDVALSTHPSHLLISRRQHCLVYIALVALARCPMMVILLIQKISRIHSEIEVVWKMLSILASAKWLKDFFLIPGFEDFSQHHLL